MSTYHPSEYGDTWASEYDKVFEGRNNLQDVTRFLLSRVGNGSAVEFGIGTGRMSFGLAEAGVKVYGIDASQEMLNILKSKPSGQQIHTVVGNFVDTKFDDKFSLVYILCSTLFMLESQKDQVECIKNAAKHLTSDGTLVIECFVPDPSRWVRGQTSFVSSLDNEAVDFLVAVHDPVHQLIRNQHIYLSNGSVQLKPIQLRYAWPTEIDLMAQVAGLKLTERYADYDESPFIGTSTHHVSVYSF